MGFSVGNDTRFISLSTFLNYKVSFQIKLSIESVKNKINDFKVITLWDLFYHFHFE